MCSSDLEEVFLGRDFNHTRNYSEDIAREIDKHISNIIEECYNESVRLLEENRRVLDEASEILIEKEKITGKQFRRIMNGEPVDLEEEEVSIFQAVEEDRKEKAAKLAGVVAEEVFEDEALSDEEYDFDEGEEDAYEDDVEDKE